MIKTLTLFSAINMSARKIASSTCMDAMAIYYANFERERKMKRYRECVRKSERKSV